MLNTAINRCERPIFGADKPYKERGELISCRAPFFFKAMK